MPCHAIPCHAPHCIRMMNSLIGYIINGHHKLAPVRLNRRTLFPYLWTSQTSRTFTFSQHSTSLRFIPLWFIKQTCFHFFYWFLRDDIIKSNKFFSPVQRLNGERAKVHSPFLQLISIRSNHYLWKPLNSKVGRRQKKSFALVEKWRRKMKEEEMLKVINCVENFLSNHSLVKSERKA